MSMQRDFTQLSWSSEIEEDLRRLMRLAVFEDLDRGQDWTTVCLVPEEAQATATVVVRKPGTVAGLPAIGVILDEMEIEDDVHLLVRDGDAVHAGTVVATVSGP